MQLNAVLFHCTLCKASYLLVQRKTFFLMVEYLGRPFGMSNKPHSKILLNTASFYLRERLRGLVGWKSGMEFWPRKECQSMAA